MIGRPALLIIVALGGTGCTAAPTQTRDPQSAALRTQIAAQKKQLKILGTELAAKEKSCQALRKKLSGPDAARCEPAVPARPARPASRAPDPEHTYPVVVGDSPARGPADAWVTVVVFSEFDCTFCARVHQSLSELLTALPGELRVVFKHKPLAVHPRSRPAAVASECAREQGHFWTMHDLLFARHRRLSADVLGDAAKQAGLDVQRFSRCLKKTTPHPRIARDRALASQLGVRATPALFINGRYLAGAIPPGVLRAQVAAELAKAKKSGVASPHFYQQMVVNSGGPR